MQQQCCHMHVERGAGALPPRWRQILEIDTALPEDAPNFVGQSTIVSDHPHHHRMKASRAAGARDAGGCALAALPDHLLELSLPCKGDGWWKADGW